MPPRPAAEWHDATAADDEQDSDAFGAAWHLDRLAVFRPNDWTLAARHGRVLAAAGRRDEAAGRTAGVAWNRSRADELEAPPAKK